MKELPKNETDYLNDCLAKCLGSYLQGSKSCNAQLALDMKLDVLRQEYDVSLYEPLNMFFNYAFAEEGCVGRVDAYDNKVTGLSGDTLCDRVKVLLIPIIEEDDSAEPC